MEQVQLQTEQIQTALKQSPEFFIQFFLGEELTYPVPGFHQDIFAQMVQREILFSAFAIPRDHAKTTLAKLAVVYMFLFSDIRFAVYLSNTHGIAVPASRDIMNFLESDNCRAVFGPVEREIWREGEGVFVFYMRQISNRRFILKAMGAGQQIRGMNIDNQRPQFAVIDDLEDTDNIASEKMLGDLTRWLYGNFMKAMDNKNSPKFVHIGNMIMPKQILRMHCESQDWVSRRYGAILANGESLWPDAWPLQALLDDYRRYQEVGQASTWFAEMMNLPMPMAGGIIRAEEITYLPVAVPEEYEYGFLTIDLAISNKTWADNCVVAVHGYHTVRGIWQVVETRYWKGIDPIKLFDEVIEMGSNWGFQVVGIESVAYQSALKFVYDHLCLVRHLENWKFVDIPTGHTKKAARIITWAAMLKQTISKMPTYAISHGDFFLTGQLLTYDPMLMENDDDGIDAASMGVIMQNMYMYEIVSQIRIQVPIVIQTSYEVATV